MRRTNITTKIAQNILKKGDSYAICKRCAILLSRRK